MKPTELVERILKLSKSDDMVVIVEEASGINVRFANNTTTTNGATSTQELIIIAIRGKRVGMLHRSYVDAEKLEDLVREAEANCEYQQAAEDYTELVAGVGEPNGWDRPTQPTSIEVFGKLSEQLSKEFKAAAGDGLKLFGYAEHSSSTLWLATSRGIRRRNDQQRGQIELTMKTEDFKSSSWAGQASKDFADVDVHRLVSDMRQSLEWSKTKGELPAGAYDTLLTPSAVADMLIYAYWTASARDAAEGRTVFSAPKGKTRVGEKLAVDGVSIYSDPKEPGLEVADFEIVSGTSSWQSVFDNGVKLARTPWIEDGVLQHLVTPRYWAEKSGGKATPIIENLVMQAGGKGTLHDMIKNVKRGLLVNTLWYIREVDPQRLLLTGLTRDGVFLIENGEVKGAVNNFRWNMSPVEMLGKIVSAGESVQTLPREWGDYFTFAKTPPLVIRDFNMSSVSQAN
jgi:predicted Zn-dependent protease